jgi:hypothetical protein
VVIALVGTAVAIAATGLKSQTVTPSSAAPPSAGTAVVHTLQLPGSLDAVATSSEGEDALDRSAHESLADPAPERIAPPRRARAPKAAPSRDLVAGPAAARDALVGGPPEPRPSAPQTFSGIVVDDDALDQRH